MGYGTGAIMAVPAHDQRDYEFATRFGLPIVPVIFPRGRGSAGGRGVPERRDHAATAVPSTACLRRKRCGRSPRYLAGKGVAQAKVNYRLRDWCISRQRYWGPPIPIIYCDACGIVRVPEADLPVVLPEIDDFRPDASGVSPLARVESFYHATCPQCGGKARRETDVSDNFLDSAWYFLRYPSADRDDVAWDPELTRKWLPVNLYIGGNEHAVLHLMYTRFLCMAFHDMGLTEFERAVREVPRPRTDHSRRRQDVEVARQRRQSRQVRRRARGRHLPDVPDVPRALRGGGGLPGPGDRRDPPLPRPRVALDRRGAPAPAGRRAAASG